MSYSTAAVSAIFLGLSLIAKGFGVRDQAFILGLLGAGLFLLISFPAMVVLERLVNAGNKKARIEAKPRAANYINPTTYPTGEAYVPE